jgi:CrcB protein
VAQPDPAASDLPVDPDAGPGTDVFRQRSRTQRRWDIALVIAAGGAVGGGARYLLSTSWPHPDGGFPWATFIENVSGSLLLGALMVFLLEVWRPRRYARPFLGVGVLGGYTTFSTYTADIDALLRAGAVPVALAYLFGTLVVGFFATWTGLTLARRIAGITSTSRRTA